MPQLWYVSGQVRYRNVLVAHKLLSNGFDSNSILLSLIQFDSKLNPLSWHG